MEQRYASYVLRLREMFLNNLEAKRAEIFALESELRGPGADRAKLEEDGIEPSRQLSGDFSHKSQSRSEPSR